MSRGYPFIDGHAKKISISVSSSIWNIIQKHPNRSGLINNILEREFLLHGNPEIDDRLKKIGKELIEIENAIKTLNSKKSTLIEEQQDLMRQQGAIQNDWQINVNAEREKVLKMFVSKKVTKSSIHGWFEGRIDVMKKCGFKSPEEATEWILMNMDK